MREVTELESGRHADPVDQADAILWAADLRVRAVQLVDNAQHARQHMHEADAQALIDWSSQWLTHAYQLLWELAVTRG